MRIRRFIVRVCADADKAHVKSLRAYAHTYCQEGNVICAASELFTDGFDPGHRDGIISHEVGHLLAGPDASEEDADRAFEAETGVRIRYKDGPHGRCLQWLSPQDRKSLIGRFEFDFEGQVSDAPGPDGDAVRFFVKDADGKRELGSLEEAEVVAASDEEAEVWAAEGRRRLGWRPMSRNPFSGGAYRNARSPEEAARRKEAMARALEWERAREAERRARVRIAKESLRSHPLYGAGSPFGRLGVRAAKALEAFGARTVADAAEITPCWLRFVKGCGSTTFEELHRFLGSHGRSLASCGCAVCIAYHEMWSRSDEIAKANARRRGAEQNPPRSPDAWKTPPPCDVEATGKPLTKAISKKLAGKPVRVHLNLHNGCYVFTSKGLVTAYARFFYLKDVLPRVGVGGYRRCHELKVRNVHAYLEGTFVDGKPPAKRGKGWRQITYNCKTNQRPCFYYVDNDECFDGAAEVRAWRVDNGDGTERCEVWARGEPPERKKNPPECQCELPGGACSCGAVDEECARVVACGGTVNGEA